MSASKTGRVCREGSEPLPSTSLDAWRLSRAKTAYVTRHFNRLRDDSAHGYSVVTGERVVPRSGDVVLAAIGAIGQHPRIELANGRKALLFVGDEVLVAYGGRYAPDQFEAEVPGDLGPVSLVAAGGVAGRVASSHSSMRKPTELLPVGLLADAHGIVTLARCSPYHASGDVPRIRSTKRPVTIAVIGTSMNCGKTTTVASIVHGLTAAGLHVAAGKVTGTGAGGDPGLFVDSGAVRVLDFTDFGHASTYQLSHAEIRALFYSLHQELARGRPDAIILEIADGLFQDETRHLVSGDLFGEYVDTVLFAAGEAMGAVAGVETIRRLSLDVAAVSGWLTASPLSTREAEGVLDIPVYTIEQLSTAEHATRLLPEARVQVAPSEPADRESNAV